MRKINVKIVYQPPPSPEAVWALFSSKSRLKIDSRDEIRKSSLIFIMYSRISIIFNFVFITTKSTWLPDWDCGDVEIEGASETQ